MQRSDLRFNLVPFQGSFRRQESSQNECMTRIYPELGLLHLFPVRLIGQATL